MSSGLKKTQSLIKIAVVFNVSYQWAGGVSYFRNLFRSVSSLKERKIQFILFTGRIKKNKNVIDEFKPYVQVIKSIYFDNPGGLLSMVWKLCFCLSKLIFNSDYFDYLMRKNGVSVVSHSVLDKKLTNLKTIGWIADFQHLALPQMFSRQEITFRNTKYLEIIKLCDVVIVNSKSVFNDSRLFVSKYIYKVRILPFITIPVINNFNDQHADKIMKKYQIQGKYFYMPNQFWKHKNHKIVFEAIKLLNEKKINIQVVLSGLTQDNRDLSYYPKLYKYINNLGIQNNIRILGIIDYEEVLYFMRYSISVINASLFEGWSSTVEEAKSLGKNVIISDIMVHREQNHPEAIYFSPSNKFELARILKRKWQYSDGGPDFSLEQKAKRLLEQRIKNFGKAYQKIVLELVN